MRSRLVKKARPLRNLVVPFDAPQPMPMRTSSTEAPSQAPDAQVRVDIQAVGNGGDEVLRILIPRRSSPDADGPSSRRIVVRRRSASPGISARALSSIADA